MKTLSLPGTWCGDCTPMGSWVALYPQDRPDPRIQTSLGRVELPGQNVLTLVCADIGSALCFAGAGHQDDLAYLWNGNRWIPLVETYGTSPCAFGPFLGAPALYVSCPGLTDNVKIFDPLTGMFLRALTQPIGGRGFASVDARGVHPQDAWYGHHGLGEYVDVEGYYIGQGTTINGLKVADYGMLVPGPPLCQFNRAHLAGNQFAVASWLPDHGRTELLWPTVADLATLPPDATPPEPIGPRSEPRAADGRAYDLLPFILGDPATWPRSGTHPMHQVLAGGLFHFVKFGTDLPAPYVPGEAYETWAHDEHWIYHLEDASSEPYHFSDPRWYPRRMKIGEAHAFDTGWHSIVYTRRVGCASWRTDDVIRRMWLHAVYDRFYWGPDLHERVTGLVVYDPSASQVIDGIRVGIDGRNIELGYYAYGAGSARWESYPSQKVYSGGDGVARFREADVAMRSDFYLFGGPALQPKLTGCVPQVVPHYPPWEPPQPPEEDEMIAYGTPAPGFLPGEERDNGNGTISVKKPNGQWLCVTPDGHVEERPSGGGPWESFKRGKNGASLIAERGDRIYVLPRADY